MSRASRWPGNHVPGLFGIKSGTESRGFGGAGQDSRASRCCRLAGKLHLKKAVFYDLTVPSGTKLTAVPADPPVEPEEPEPAEAGE